MINSIKIKKLSLFITSVFLIFFLIFSIAPYLPNFLDNWQHYSELVSFLKYMLLFLAFISWNKIAGFLSSSDKQYQFILNQKAPFSMIVLAVESVTWLTRWTS